MNILIDINHPAHVHLFKNFALIMMKRGNKVLFTTRNKEIAHILLDRLGFEFISFGKHYKSLWGKLWGIFKFDFQIWRVAIKFKPNVFVSMGSIYASHASFLVRKPHILLQDTEKASYQHRLSVPFADCVVNPVCFERKFKKQQIFYKGYHELAYLHPKRFKPDKTLLKDIGVKEGEKFVIMRFVSWNANHDVGHNGLSQKNKIKAVKEFSKYAKVLITSEAELPLQLKAYQLKMPIEKIHHVMAFASLLYGESATMASECAVMGVPAIYIDNDGRGYTKEQETKYGIVYNFTESEEDQCLSIDKGVKILSDSNARIKYEERHHKMMSEKIDVTEFIVWLIDNYPQNKDLLLKDPNYQMM